MGRVTETVKIQNYEDVALWERGKLNESNVRTVKIEAIVDTGATYLCLPPSVIKQLGLLSSHSRKVITANDEVERRVFKGADITIQRRNEQMSVMENDKKTPPLIGYLVLEAMDFVVDSKAQKIIPNPAHEGRWVADLL